MPTYFDYQRISEGSSFSGKFGESVQATEVWQIKVDDPTANRAQMLAGVTGTMGITWGTPHPEFPDIVAMEFSLAPYGRDGLRWKLEVKYYAPKRLPGENGLPEDQWERDGGTTTIPAFRDFNEDMIVNSAGDPLEGIEKEREESSWTLVKSYDDDESLELDVSTYAGTLNDSNWAGGYAKTWKCYFRRAKKSTISKLDGADDAGKIDYIEAEWEFRYDPETWVSKPWDVGFAELNGSGDKVAITTDDGKTVKQPVALNSDGSARAPGDPPLVANGGDGFDLYDTSDFAATFGEPFILAGSS